ncbi:MFS transporter [Ktedonosporobacter rubrisoli]|uniref:MFS transporter n=1 Tax=Ktedonosporobacter rubrisoli TaxID=2509675 RepID=A0A4P6JU32_KTERU|nr:MFS transporter [Ktedonosporobacter rubrisoli]QBD79129.1 MFS transporter [Ktedonosporobacter rubrisoli]
MFAVLKQRNFALLWTGQIVSMAGDWLLVIALPFYIYQLTGSVLQTGLMFMIEILPRIILGSIAGVFVDRWNRRWTMLIADLLRAGSLLLLLLAHSRDFVWLIYCVSLLEAIFSQFFTPASNAVTPQLVKDEQLLAANSLESFNDAITRLVGPPLGGAIFALWSMSGVVLLDSLTFLFSALMILLISPSIGVREKQAQKAPAETVRQVWHEWLDGLRLVGKNRTVKGVFVSMSLLMINQGIINVLLVVIVKVLMHGNELTFSWLLTAQGVGALVGALLIGMMSKFIRPVFLLVSGLAMIGIALIILAYIPVLLIDLPVLALVGLCAVGAMVVVQTLLQQAVADQYRGRLFGTFSTITSVWMMLGMVIASLFGDSVGAVPLLDVAAFFSFLAALAGLFMLFNARLEPSSEAPLEVGTVPLQE